VPRIGSIRVERRFCGPPESGNGGYVAGLLAAHLHGPGVVRLRVPPPLETELAVVPADDGLELRDGDAIVATARPGGVAFEPPAPPTVEQAHAAAQRFRGFDVHPFPGCFVCGTARAARDGLRIFAGPLGESDRVACVWTPDDTLAGPGGSLAEPFVWAALDCPGAFAFPQVDGVSLLGELAVEVRAPVPIGRPATLFGWEERAEGRKHFTGTALYDEDGHCLALGAATWIELPVVDANANGQGSPRGRS
jgi:hypothetical protein